MTRLFLYVHAGGRCEFDGCNDYLLEHHVTKTDGNFAEMAHIFAFSGGGPRAKGRKGSDIHALSNLMLLCPKCHKEIDENPAKWTGSVLRRFKRAHEDRVFMLTGTSPDRDTTAVVLRGMVAGKPVTISTAEMQAAVAPRYVSAREACQIDLSQLPDSHDPGYWDQGSKVKDRLKTNLNVHIDHIKDSGVADVIRLMKLWNVRNGIGAKTFVLELLTVKILESKQSKDVSSQLEHVWTEFRDNAENLAVEDPANPNGNDLKPPLDACRWRLSSIARTTLANIESQGWESVFGPLKDDQESQESKAAAIHVAVARAAVPTRPWCGGA